VHRALDGPQAKIARAGEHLEALNNEVIAFFNIKPDSLAGEYDAESGWYAFRLQLTPAPLRMGVLVGDFVHNLRSALDHFIWQLVAFSGGNPGRSNQFPIYTSEADFLRDVEERVEDRGPGPLAGLGEDTPGWAFVKGFQPYHRGDRAATHPLTRLNRLSNEDKHRVVPPAFLAVGGEPGVALFDFQWNEGEIIDNHIVALEDGQRLENDAELARVRLEGAGSNPDVQMDVNFQVRIAFGTGDPAATMYDLADMAEHVGRMIEMANRLFDPS
jgi:hypothetical protein